MILGKINPVLKIPYSIAKGSHSQRQIKSCILSDKLFQSISSAIKDDSSAFSYQELQKYIYDVLPDKNLKIIVKKMEEKFPDSDAECDLIYNANKEIKALCINLSGNNNYIDSKLIPAFIHEFQHVADEIYHPKFLSRLQNLNKKNYNNSKYVKFYDQYYYYDEFIECKKDKKNLLKYIKHKTQNFLKGLSTEDKINYIQDMRYCLMSEIEAYKKQIEVANHLKSKGITVNSFDFYDYPKEGLFEDKIKLLKNIALEYISRERGIYASRLKKKK